MRVIRQYAPLWVIELISRVEKECLLSRFYPVLPYQGSEIRMICVDDECIAWGRGHGYQRIGIRKAQYRPFRRRLGVFILLNG